MIILDHKYKTQEQVVILNDSDDDLKEIVFPCPDIPNDRDILNYGMPQHLQKFYHVKYPERLIALMKRISKEVDEHNGRTRMKADRKIFADEMHRELRKYKDKYDDIWRFILEEWRRRLYGVWFFNNGIRTYVTGKMYYWMNYWSVTESEIVYMDRDRRFFHFLTEAVNDKDCIGIVEMTRRKTGKSVRAAMSLYEEMTRMINRHCGIQSKNDKDASDLFDKVVLGWKGMPFFFQPIHSHLLSAPASELKFTTGEGEQIEQIDLGSFCDFRSAKASAYDSTYLGYYISDEEGKLETVNAMQRWDVVKPAMFNPFGQKTGFSHHTTTVEEVGREGFRPFKEIWDGSDYHKRNALNRTETGLWRVFFPAYDGEMIDDFGMSKLRESKEKLDIERSSLKEGSGSYYENIRKFPYTTRECFTINAAKCPFDKDKLYKRSMFFFNGNDYIRVGDFVWKNGEKNTEVEFIDNPKGRFRVSYLPSESLRNKSTIRGGIKVPANGHLFVAGGDTFNFDVTEGEGSNGGGAVFMRFNPVMESPLSDMPEGLTDKQKNDMWFRYKTKRFVCTYNFRPPSKEEYIDDMIKMCVFYGCQMFPEMNHPHIQDGFKKRKYVGYLMHKYDEKKQKLKDNSGDVTNDLTKDALFMVVQEHILSSCDYEFHNEFLDECLSVTYDKMTDYDLFSACAYALYGNSLSMHLVEAEKQRNKKRDELRKDRNRQYFEENTIL